MRTIGTVARGIRAPIVKEGDDVVQIVVDSVLHSAQTEGYPLHDLDVVGVTESLVARAQGNYASVHDIAEHIRRLFPSDQIAVVFPILSRNRFSLILKGIALSGKMVHLFLNFPSDEVGNHLMDIDEMHEAGVSPALDLLTEERYRSLFGEKVAHPFTGIDYVEMYKQFAVNDNIQIYLTNTPEHVLKYSKDVLVANVHDRHRTMSLLKKAGANIVLGLEHVLSEPIHSSGYNPEYGLLGSNMATEETIKLFPRDCHDIVIQIQRKLYERTGKHIEVMVYGDGAFKDPMGKIWELADPVVSPGFTPGLEGTPNELKLKYIADGELRGLSEQEMAEAIRKRIEEKDHSKAVEAQSLGTTPRKITDLLGSLCDLTSGSGDKGTPIVLVQGYFDNYASK